MLDDLTIDRITRRGVSEIISYEEFVRLLQLGEPLRLKMGFDPSRPDIHLGHVVGLRKLRQLQELGHKVILIVGDWTAQIGDPSGQSATRPMLTHQEVISNAESYLRQFFKVVDKDRAEVVWQSEWFGKFTLEDVIRLTSKFTVSQFLQRADFALRFQEHRPIAITELLYPLLQAYDSVMINSDVEFGGTDQKFNLLVGRELQEKEGQRPQQLFMMPILVGTDGVMKMSKSLDNYVSVEEPPNDMYGKLMSLPDGSIVSYFEYLTDAPDEELAGMRRDLEAQSVNPMNLKKRLALEITGQFHDGKLADAAQANFEQVVQGRSLPEDIPGFNFSGYKSDSYFSGPPGSSEEPVGTPASKLPLLLTEAGIASSNTEAKRLLRDGAIELITQSGESQRLSAISSVQDLSTGDVLRRGSRRFVRLVEG
ncbi:MAG: tyrosine--tRNA ligase [SAR202 cluster bacterium Io17-Chloro-G7]|nr:MAG: tyrosine--tRNA ligase [SAR202 cluster bacterium Io17-Chloro-G7]